MNDLAEAEALCEERLRCMIQLRDEIDRKDHLITWLVVIMFVLGGLSTWMLHVMKSMI